MNITVNLHRCQTSYLAQWFTHLQAKLVHDRGGGNLQQDFWQTLQKIHGSSTNLREGVPVLTAVERRALSRESDVESFQYEKILKWSEEYLESLACCDPESGVMQLDFTTGEYSCVWEIKKLWESAADCVARVKCVWVCESVSTRGRVKIFLYIMRNWQRVCAGIESCVLQCVVCVHVCSACVRSRVGSVCVSVYVCWLCEFFLHECVCVSEKMYASLRVHLSGKNFLKQPF